MRYHYIGTSYLCVQPPTGPSIHCLPGKVVDLSEEVVAAMPQVQLNLFRKVAVVEKKASANPPKPEPLKPKIAVEKTPPINPEESLKKK